ncbi:MAG: secretion system protein E, partial [Verrucomicrobia bacterium]|nr:secretion system protein E [Verrucomicrobiota bacterium]
MPPIKSFGERIADALIEDSLVAPQQVEELLQIQKKEGTRLLKLLIDKSYVSDVDMVVSMGRVLNTAPINLSRISIPPEVAGLVPREVAVNYKVLPVSRLDNKLFLAMADPLNVLALDDVKRITKLDVQPMIAPEKSILDKINNLDAAKGGTMEDIIKSAQEQEELEREAEGAELITTAVEDLDAASLAAQGEEAPVIKLANRVLVDAINDRASDIH